MPVEPLVPSTSVPPGLNTPLASPASTTARATRSFPLPPGYKNSALPQISHPVAADREFIRIIRVFPINPEYEEEEEEEEEYEEGEEEYNEAEEEESYEEGSFGGPVRSSSSQSLSSSQSD